MSRILKSIWKVIQGGSALFLALLLMGNLYLIAMQHIKGVECPALFGYSTAVIVSGSMEPALSMDDLIFNHAQPGYEEGDIITFQNGGSLTTHRIMEVTEDGYVTRGDANNAADPDTVSADAVVGKVVGKIPYVGSVLAFLKTPFGMMALVFTGALLLELPFLLQRRRNNMDEEGPNET